LKADDLTDKLTKKLLFTPTLPTRPASPQWIEKKRLYTPVAPFVSDHSFSRLQKETALLLPACGCLRSTPCLIFYLTFNRSAAMGDRKVTNKYIPADFDPSLVPKGKKLSSKDGTVPVRMMLPRYCIEWKRAASFGYNQ